MDIKIYSFLTTSMKNFTSCSRLDTIKPESLKTFSLFFCFLWLLYDAEIPTGHVCLNLPVHLLAPSQFCLWTVLYLFYPVIRYMISGRSQ